MKIETKTLTVTPEMAKNWLAKYNNRNRNVRPAAVDIYAKDMKSGNWAFTHQGIAFYENGVLADGQHRLLAVVKANIPVKFLVTNGLPIEVGAAVDQHVRRQAHDALQISGLAPWANRNITAIARFVMSDMGQETKPRGINHIAEFLHKYKSLFETVDRTVISKKRHVTHSGILAVYFCALHSGVSVDVIRRFSKVMYSGEAEGPSENSAIRLREYLMMNPQSWVGQARVETCKRAMRALKAFEEKQPLGKIVMPVDFIYPVPR